VLHSLRAAAGEQLPAPPPAEEAPLEQQRLVVRVFGNLDWLSNRGDVPNTFTVGQLDVFAVSELAPSLSVLAEVVFEAPHHEEAQIADVERFQVRWAPADPFGVSVGRMHTMLGYWNQAYHHGAWLQTTVFRPEVYRWEDESGGFLPVHEVGLRVSGALSPSAGRLEYSATVANGRAVDPSDVVTLQDPNAAKAVDLWIGIQPGVLRTLQLGAAAVFDTIPPDPARPGREEPLDERILGVFLAYPGSRLELLAEAFAVRHESQAGGGRWESSGLYAQAAIALGRFKPYYRFDHVERDEGDPYYGPVTQDVTKHSLGLRVDPWSRLALKVELAHTRPAEGAAFTAVAAQAAFTF
jgi:hypothetical protein